MHSVNDFVIFVKSHNSDDNYSVNLPIYNDKIRAYNDNYKVTTKQTFFEADRPERTHDMKKYFNVSFQYSESVYCANIAHAESAETVVAHYSAKYEWCKVSEATAADVEEAQRKGKPIIDIETPKKPKATQKMHESKTARAEWESMSGEQQYNALVAMAWTVRRKAEARNQTGAAWIETEDDAQTVAADAWTRMGAALDRNEAQDAPAPLAVILYRAAAQAAHSISRAEQRHARAISATIDDDGAERWQIDTEAGADCDAIAPSPEAAAILRESVESVARDQVDRVALTMTARGYTTAEIAAALMVDRSTISRRLYAMRDRYHAQQGEEAEA